MICGVCEGREGGVRITKWIGVCTHLTQLAHLLAESTNACEGSTAWVLQAHFVYHGVYFSWEDAHDGEGGHVQADARPGLEFICRKCGSV